MQDLVTVFGGSGFVGRQVVRALARGGWRVRVAVRKPHLAEDMRLGGEVGQIQLVQANVRHDRSVAAALDGAVACVNAVGQAVERGPQTFEAVHVDGARRVAAAARKAGARRLIQFSGVGASADSTSKYARARAAGEAAVREAFANADILRPSVVFGANDRVTTLFARLAAMSPAVPLVGADTRLQPVSVGDIAKAARRLLATETVGGGAYELGGPEVLTVRELVERICAEIQRRPGLIPLPFFAADLMARVGDLAAAIGLPAPITTDQVELLREDNVATGPGLADLGVAPTPLEAVLASYLYRYRPGGQYADNLKRAGA
ncbi:MAG: complex I NDUFA9 subunit family protein [Caulobacteraceae bacterium]|nr:complex I NDUFA9 subunit family protein [Caulobacteraceae bacterium]